MIKKLFYGVLFVIIIVAVFFFYESSEFNSYINNPVIGNMNIPINNEAPVKSRGQIEINAPVEVVWQILTDIKNWPKWQKAVTETVVNGKINEGTEFNWKAGGLSFKSRIHTSVPKSKFGWTGTTIGASAVHNWIFEAKENQTIVIVEESLQGVFPKLFSGYFQKNLDSGIATNLTELKTAAESK